MKRILLTILLILAMGITPCYSADQLDKTKPADDTLLPDFPALQRTNTEAFDRVASDLQRVYVFFSSTTAVTVSAGSVVCSNLDGSVRRYRTNTSTTNVTFSNLDTGVEASGTYYIYAIADTDATTFTVVISINSSAPQGGETYYKKIGSFFNNSSSDIDNYKVYSNAYLPAPTDANGIPKVTAIYSYASSYSSYTLKQSNLKFAFGFARNIAGGGTQAVTNLPFESASTYSATCASFGSQNGAAYPSVSSIDSGSQFTIRNNHTDATNNNGDCNWIAVGY